MKHASRPTTFLHRLTLPVAATSLLLGSTFVLSTASADETGGGGNESCAAGQTEIKFDSGDLRDGRTMTSGGFSVTLSGIKSGSESDSPTATMGNEVLSFGYVASAGLVTVIVKGGPTAYRITSPSLIGKNIVGPPNPKSGKTYGVSNVKFCFALVASPSPSVSVSVSPSPSASVSPSPSASASVSPSPSASMSVSPSPSASPSASVSPSPSVSVSVSPSPSSSPSASASVSPSPSASVSPSPLGGTGGGGGGGGGGGTGTGTIGGGSGGGAAGPTTEGGSGTGTIGGGSGGGAAGPTTQGGGAGAPSALPRTGGLVDTALVAALWAFVGGLVLIGLGRRRSERSS